jgi:hypothetical protein
MVQEAKKKNTQSPTGKKKKKEQPSPTSLDNVACVVAEVREIH